MVLHPSYAGLYQPPSDAGIRAPLLDGQADGSANVVVNSDSRTSSGVTASNGRGPQLWAPLEYEAMPRWRWVDWCRYLFYRWGLAWSAIDYKLCTELRCKCSTVDARSCI